MYKVEKVIGKRQSLKRKGKFQYLIKWEGWDLKDSTWQPEKNLQFVKDLIEQYQKQQDQNKNEDATSVLGSIISIFGMESLNSINSTTTKPKNEKKHKGLTLEENTNREEKRQKQNKGENRELKLNKKQAVGEKQIKLTGQFNILGMKKDGINFWYYVIDSNEVSYWVLRDYLINHFPRKLCQFYESKLEFIT